MFYYKTLIVSVQLTSFISSTTNVSSSGLEVPLDRCPDNDNIVQDSASSSFNHQLLHPNIPPLAVSILEPGLALGDLNLASMDFCIPEVDSSKGVTGPLTCLVLCMYFLGGKDP